MIDAADVTEGSVRPQRSMLDRLELAPLDAIVLAGSMLFVVAFIPSLMFPGWTPRFGLLLALAPVGWLLLLRLIARRDAAGVLAGCAVAWVLLAGFFSGDARSALLGFAGRDLSALVVAASLGCWALGRSITARGVELVGPVVVGSAVASAVVGALQVILDVRTGPLALASGRPIGFQTNPVYFGALCTCAMAIALACAALHPLSSRRWAVWAGAIFVLGVGASLSGSRVALLSALVAAVAVPAVHRRRPAVIGSLVSVLSLGAGVAVDRLVGQGRNAADRLGGEAGGGRVQAWGYAVDAWRDRPVFGFGFGRFRSAVQGRFSEQFVRDHIPSEAGSPWFDAHNVVVGVLVAVGVVGLVLIAAWAFAAALRTRGPLAWGVLPIALSWLVQPVALTTLPIALVLLGAAHRRGDRDIVGDRAISRTQMITLSVLGLAALSYVVGADLMLRSAADSLDGDRAERSARLYFDDPIANDVVAQVYFHVRGDEGAALYLEWRHRVVDAEPDRPHWWSSLSRAQIASGDLAAADRSVRRALELQRYNVGSLRTADVRRLQHDLDQLCRLGQECDRDAAELLADFEARADEAADEAAP